ncbi:MAG TPA: nitrilase-related carbon-nitrogen hydrolase, partial [Coriobacteriia bacterium]
MARIALAQIDGTVGDIARNADLVIGAVHAARAQGADLVLTPELALAGYPPEDLVAKAHFVDGLADALARVAAACTGITAVVGFVERDGNVLHNSAAVCSDGAVTAVYRKRRLPNYGVFDEERYFEPGTEPLLIRVAGEPCALTICEDVWVPELVAEAATAGATVVLNISASPFHSMKGSEREEMLRDRAADSRVHLLYCNLVGGQDELVFDGRSVAIDPAGNVMARAKAFAPDLLLVDVPAAPSDVREEPL